MTEVQRRMRDCILAAVRGRADRRIVYEREYLGYLPFGFYHWVQCGDQKVSDWFPDGWQSPDMEALERDGTLRKVDTWTDSRADDHTRVTFEVAPGEPRKPGESLAEAMAGLRAEVEKIAGQIAFIRRELPSRQADAAVLQQVGRMCGEFEETLDDVRKEVQNLGGKLGLHSDMEEGINPDPAPTVSMIYEWLLADVKSLRALIEQVRPQAQGGSAVLLVLLEESGAGILRAFGLIHGTLASIMSQLR